VRNLAQRSATAAKEIKELIDDSVSKVEIGSKLVEQAGSTMQEVVDSVRRVTDIMAEISTASEEQRAGISQVHEAITQMDQVTQQNAALVEEAAAAARRCRTRRMNWKTWCASSSWAATAAPQPARAGTAPGASKRAAPVIKPPRIRRLFSL
jgi:uncharacterized phage infection (PIP) family protein YhgE